jgi:two-component system phosphate regulon sensor histidine kinase PhoR
MELPALLPWLALLFGLLCFIMFMVDSFSLVRLARAVRIFVKDKKRVPLHLSRGVPGAVRVLARAFAELVAEVELLRKRDAEVARIKSDFMATAAHQLQTPITGIRWAVESLKKVALEEQDEFVSNIDRESRELAELVRTFIEISNLESGRITYSFAPVDVVQVAQEAAELYRVRAREAGVELSLTLAEDVPTIRADYERVKEALGIIIENAISYTPSGGTVRVSVKPAPHLVLVEVQDTGIGILENDQSNIFEIFYRGGNASTKTPKGSGLGLYIAREIARAHGGDISFKNNMPGVGVTFTLSFAAL